MRYPTIGRNNSFSQNVPMPDGGINASDLPQNIAANQLAAGKNLYFADGMVKTRPGLKVMLPDNFTGADGHDPWAIDLGVELKFSYEIASTGVTQSEHLYRILYRGKHFWLYDTEAATVTSMMTADSSGFNFTYRDYGVEDCDYTFPYMFTYENGQLAPLLTVGGVQMQVFCTKVEGYFIDAHDTDYRAFFCVEPEISSGVIVPKLIIVDPASGYPAGHTPYSPQVVINAGTSAAEFYEDFNLLYPGFEVDNGTLTFTSAGSADSHTFAANTEAWGANHWRTKIYNAWEDPSSTVRQALSRISFPPGALDADGLPAEYGYVDGAFDETIAGWGKWWASDHSRELSRRLTMNTWESSVVNVGATIRLNKIELSGDLSALNLNKTFNVAKCVLPFNVVNYSYRGFRYGVNNTSGGPSSEHGYYPYEQYYPDDTPNPDYGTYWKYQYQPMFSDAVVPMLPSDVDNAPFHLMPQQGVATEPYPTDSYANGSRVTENESTDWAHPVGETTPYYSWTYILFKDPDDTSITTRRPILTANYNNASDYQIDTGLYFPDGSLHTGDYTDANGGEHHCIGEVSKLVYYLEDNETVRIEAFDANGETLGDVNLTEGYYDIAPPKLTFDAVRNVLQLEAQKSYKAKDTSLVETERFTRAFSVSVNGVSGYAINQYVDYVQNPESVNTSIMDGPGSSIHCTMDAELLSANSRRELVTKNKINTWFGGTNSGFNAGTRLFAAGHPQFKNVLRWSGVNDATYFKENNFAYIGRDDEEITALAKQDGYLIVFKENEMYALEYQQTEDANDNLIVYFPIKPISPYIGCDCPDTVQFIDSRLTWLHSNGTVYALISESHWNENTVRPLSANITPLLKQHPAAMLKKAISADFNGNYLIAIPSSTGETTVYVWSYSHAPFYSGYNNETSQQTLSWWKWTLPYRVSALYSYDNRLFATCHNHLDGETDHDGVFLFELVDGQRADEFAADTDGEGADKKEAYYSKIQSELKSKQFDFGRPYQFKKINRTFFETKTDPSDYVSVRFYSPDDTVDQSTRLNDTPNNNFSFTLKPMLHRVRAVGFEIDSDTPIAFLSATISAEAFGEVK